MYKVALSSATKVGIGKNDLGQSQKCAGPYKRARLYYYIFYIKAHAARKKPRIKTLKQYWERILYVFWQFVYFKLRKKQNVVP